MFRGAVQEESVQKSGVNVPTVLASAGVAAVVSSLVVTIGVVGMMLSGNGDDNATAAQPTVVNLGSAAAGSAAPAQAAAPAAAAAAPTTSAAAAAAAPAAAAPAPAAIAAAPAPVTEAAPAEAAPAETAESAVAAEPTQAAAPDLSVDQMYQMTSILMGNYADADKANVLESGMVAVPSVNTVAAMLATAGPAFSWTVTGPATRDGDSMYGTLSMSLIGSGTRTLPLRFVWTGDSWKISNETTCVIAEYALLQCPV